MKEAVSHSAPGLEVDSRLNDQSEKIANGGQMYAEVGGPRSQYSEHSAWQSANGSPWPIQKYQEQHQPQEQRRRAGLGGAVLWLSVALAVALVLAVVAAGVGGSLAASRGNKLASCTADKATLQKTNGSSTPAQAATTPTASANNASCTDALSVKPKSDCNLYSDTYETYEGSKYKISCNQDLKTGNLGPDIMGIFVRSMKDCMNACSSFNGNTWASNGTCYAVAVNWNVDPSRGNCWLKGILNIPSVASNGVDSASIILT